MGKTRSEVGVYFYSARKFTRNIRRLFTGKPWWFWAVGFSALCLLLVVFFRWLLNAYIVIAVSHDPDAIMGREVVVYLSLLTELATGMNRVIVDIGRIVLAPELWLEGVVRTVLLCLKGNSA
jgi:hypothetical protein